MVGTAGVLTSVTFQIRLEFPDFDKTLRKAMYDEAATCSSSRSCGMIAAFSEFIDSDYTFPQTERLAKHYGTIADS